MDGSTTILNMADLAVVVWLDQRRHQDRDHNRILGSIQRQELHSTGDTLPVIGLLRLAAFGLPNVVLAWLHTPPAFELALISYQHHHPCPPAPDPQPRAALTLDLCRPSLLPTTASTLTWALWDSHHCRYAPVAPAHMSQLPCVRP